MSKRIRTNNFTTQADSNVDALQAVSTSTQTLSVSGSTNLNNTTNNGSLIGNGSTTLYDLTVTNITNLGSTAVSSITAVSSLFASFIVRAATIAGVALSGSFGQLSTTTGASTLVSFYCGTENLAKAGLKFIRSGTGGVGRLSIVQSATTTTELPTSEVLTALPNGNIGVGNIAPAVKLDVNGSINVAGDISTAGNISLNSAPTSTSFIQRTIQPTSGTLVIFNGSNPTATQTDATPGSRIQLNTGSPIGTNSNGGLVLSSYGSTTATPTSNGNAITFRRRTDIDTTSESMRVDYQGNLGIGITQPTARLHVNGGINSIDGNFTGTLSGSTLNGSITNAGNLTATTLTVTGAASFNGRILSHGVSLMSNSTSTMGVGTCWFQLYLSDAIGVSISQNPTVVTVNKTARYLISWSGKTSFSGATEVVLRYNNNFSDNSLRAYSSLTPSNGEFRPLSFTFVKDMIAGDNVRVNLISGTLHQNAYNYFSIVEI